MADKKMSSIFQGLIDSMRTHQNNDEVMTNAEVLEDEFCSNVNEILALQAQAVGIDEVFHARTIQTQNGETFIRPYMTDEDKQKFTNALIGKTS